MSISQPSPTVQTPFNSSSFLSTRHWSSYGHVPEPFEEMLHKEIYESGPPPKQEDMSNAFRFVGVHPGKQQDREELRQNRKHVMHDYLDKERQRPNSKDPRANGRRSSKHTRLTERPRRPGKRPNVPQTPLVTNVNSNQLSKSAYMNTEPHQVPSRLGGKLEPFNSWPTFTNSNLDVKALKWSCGQRFGSYGLTIHWVPTLLRARAAFLSTLCISSSHDAIMSRAALGPAATRANFENIQRWRVKREVIAMVGERLADPETATNDETIVSVLHLLNSDVMGCDDRDMRVHQEGLHEIVVARGGLKELGVGGQLAQILVISMYMIAALREIPPHRDFADFASSQDLGTFPRSPKKSFPESPVHCKKGGFRTVRVALTSESETFKLLDKVRKLTEQFRIATGDSSRDTSNTGYVINDQEPEETVSSLSDQVFSFPHAEDMEFKEMNDRYTYEAIRLTSIVYAHALLTRQPFSTAARHLTAAPLGDQQSPASSQNTPYPIRIKNSLMRTDISTCWGQLAGVLFWISLIAGAAANPGPYAAKERIGIDEDARKWITAMGVRCCIYLSFEHPRPILNTLRSVVGIETALERRSSHVTAEKVQEVGFGPEEPPQMQRGFSDYATGFMTLQ